MLDRLIQTVVDAVSVGCLYAMTALGIGLIFGVMRLINFAHGELITATGYALLALFGLPLPAMLFGGLFCAATMGPLGLLLRKKPPASDGTGAFVTARRQSPESLGLSASALQTLLVVAGVACCVAMSMPQVHLVAYCSDLGYGPARGAQMLSLMLACGIVSRIVFGSICDRIGGLRTLLLGSILQGTALVLFLPFDGLVSLYVISALFGLFQGGIVPSYAIIVREFFDRAEAGARVALVITATLFGMALGGWMSGKIFDLTGSYRAAFLNGIAWNLVNVSIATWLLRRSIGKLALAR